MEPHTVTAAHLVGCLRRRRVRRALTAARARGAIVEAREDKGLLVSVFTIRLQGAGTQLAGPVAVLADLLGSGSAAGR